jgi:hypothetical protein
MGMTIRMTMGGMLPRRAPGFHFDGFVLRG